MTTPKGTPTDLNVWSLGMLANGRREFPNRLEVTSAPHIRRCLKAGLVEIVDTGRTLRLTSKGIAAINAHPRTPYVSEVE